MSNKNTVFTCCYLPEIYTLTHPNHHPQTLTHTNAMHTQLKANCIFIGFICLCHLNLHGEDVAVSEWAISMCFFLYQMNVIYFLFLPFPSFPSLGLVAHSTKLNISCQCKIYSNVALTRAHQLFEFDQLSPCSMDWVFLGAERLSDSFFVFDQIGAFFKQNNEKKNISYKIVVFVSPKTSTNMLKMALNVESASKK